MYFKCNYYYIILNYVNYFINMNLHIKYSLITKIIIKYVKFINIFNILTNLTYF